MRASCLVLSLLVAAAAPATSYAAPLVIQLTPVAASLTPRCADCGVHTTTTTVVDALPKHDPKVLSDLRRAANSGRAEDQFNFGREQYLVASDGKNDPAGRRRGLKWLSRAAEQGFQPAEDELIRIYQQDDGPDYSPLLARQWRIKMAETGDTWAQTVLAIDYEVGYPGIAPDVDKMLYWYGKAADGGSVNAMITLAGLYEPGTAQPDKPFADMDKAIYWYERGAALGDSYSQSRLAHIYEADGPYRNIARAIAWHEARANDTTSFPNGYDMRRLAEIYATAPEVHDKDTSFDWYERATKAYDRPSLIVMCRHPDDTVPDHFVRARLACWRLDSAEIAKQEDAAIAMADDAQALPALSEVMWRGGRRATDYVGRFAASERGTPAQQQLAAQQFWLAAGEGWPDAKAWMALHGDIAAAVTTHELDLNQLPAGYTILAPGPQGSPVQMPLAAGLAAQVAATSEFDNDVLEAYASGQIILLCNWGEDGEIAACDAMEDTPSYSRIGRTIARRLQHQRLKVQPTGGWTALSHGKWSAITINWTVAE